MSLWILELPDAEIVTPNSRAHWSKRARCARAWRDTTCWLARDARIPALDRIAITLTYTPCDRRRRDPDRHTLVAKWCLDGLVDAGVIPDDNSAHVVSTTCAMTLPDCNRRRPAWTLEVVAA